MQKVTCMVIFTENNNKYNLLNITVKHKNNNITLYSANWDKIDNKYKYDYNFNELYTDVLSFLKKNNFYVYKWKEFNTVFYDIDFININDNVISRYSYN